LRTEGTRLGSAIRRSPRQIPARPFISAVDSTAKGTPQSHPYFSMLARIWLVHASTLRASSRLPVASAACGLDCLKQEIQVAEIAMAKRVVLARARVQRGLDRMLKVLVSERMVDMF
jgi:hypothetical protein